jgi:hypothetical protein
MFLGFVLHQAFLIFVQTNSIGSTFVKMLGKKQFFSCLPNFKLFSALAKKKEQCYVFA